MCWLARHNYFDGAAASDSCEGEKLQRFTFTLETVGVVEENSAWHFDETCIKIKVCKELSRSSKDLTEERVRLRMAKEEKGPLHEAGG